MNRGAWSLAVTAIWLISNHLCELPLRISKDIILLLLCQKPDPQAFMASSITFIKWEQSDRASESFEPDNRSESGEMSEVEGSMRK